MYESGPAPARHVRHGLALSPLLLLFLLAAACGDPGSSPATPPTEVLDQENLLDGLLGGQGIGRFSDVNGDPDPSGTSFDYQDAQTFTAGVSGRLSRIAVAVWNLNGATDPVVLEIRRVASGAPDSVDSGVLGSVSVAGAAMASSDPGDPSTWPSFDVGGMGIDVVAGGVYSFSVRSVSTIPYLLNPERSLGYDRGEGFRRNRALGATWRATDRDFGFQTYVLVR